MAKYDYGSGCPCGLQYECDCGAVTIQKIYVKEKKLDEKIFDGEFDFGFTTIHEKDISDTNELEHWKNKVFKLRGLIMPLLLNLKKDPKNDYILWPGRDKKIDEFIKKIDDLIAE